MPSLTVENYLKTILLISMKSENEWVSPGQLAGALNVAPGTVTSMLKTLAESELAEYRPYEGARLTKSGWTLAMRMLRRHRLIEEFLVKTLDLTWDQVHEEAENMEHAVSDFLIDRIDEFLGHPECDPHGDPIPDAAGEMRITTEKSVPLAACKAGQQIRFVRVTDQRADFLRYLTESGIEIGREGSVLSNNPEAGIVTTEIGERSLAISHKAANSLLVEPVSSNGD
ncbi:MAG: metal-dependent transcriptional regulator [Planctomycetaceae bacterium]